MKRAIVAAAMAGLLMLTGNAGAQNFPDRQLTMIIPFAAGGPTDVLGRIMAQAMGEELKQTIIVENVGGAGGMTGGKRVADAKPDGYTMLLGTVGTQAQGQTLYKKPLYNAVTDFTPLAFPVAGVSGLLEVTALAIWGLHLVRLMYPSVLARLAPKFIAPLAGNV